MLNKFLKITLIKAGNYAKQISENHAHEMFSTSLRGMASKNTWSVTFLSCCSS